MASARQTSGRGSVQIHGSVVDAYGRPVASALIQIEGVGGNGLQSTVTDGFGEFTFTVNSPGPYTATVTTASGRAEVTIPGQEFPDLTIRLNNGNGNIPHAAASTPPTVSLNDLEAPSKAKSKLAGAEKAAEKSDFSKAWSLVNDAIRLAPSWGRAYLLRGALNLTNRNYTSARSDFATAVARNPKDSLALTEMGKLYTTTGNYKLARQYFQQALHMPPVQWPTYLELARLDIVQHNYAEADAMAASAVQCKPAAPASIHFIDGEAKYFLHQYRRAAAEFKLFLDKAPKDAKYTRSRAAAQHNLKLLAHVTGQP